MAPQTRIEVPPPLPWSVQGYPSSPHSPPARTNYPPPSPPLSPQPGQVPPPSSPLSPPPPGQDRARTVVRSGRYASCVHIGGLSFSFIHSFSHSFIHSFIHLFIRNGFHGASPHLMGVTALSTWRYQVPTGFGIQQVRIFNKKDKNLTGNIKTKC